MKKRIPMKPCQPHPDFIQDAPENALAVLGIPLDHNSSYQRGAALAPGRIRESYFCDSSNLWTETGIDLGNLNPLYDAGDVDCSNTDNAFGAIAQTMGQLLGHNNQIISLGGDHSVTYPIIEALAQKEPQLNILHLDAHPDLYHRLDNNPLSHACPFARIMENNLAQRLVQVGIRTMNGHQRKQAQRFGVEVHEMKMGMDWFDALEFQGPVYISLDLDCLDPGFAPGVSHHEPGGMTTRQVIDIIQNVRGRVIGADIVEYNPDRDIGSMTAMVAAKLLKELIGRIYQDQKNKNPINQPNKIGTNP